MYERGFLTVLALRVDFCLAATGSTSITSSSSVIGSTSADIFPLACLEVFIFITPGFCQSSGFVTAAAMGFCTFPRFLGGRPRGLPVPPGLLLGVCAAVPVAASRDVMARLTIDDSLARRFERGSSSSSSEK